MTQTKGRLARKEYHLSANTKEVKEEREGNADHRASSDPAEIAPPTAPRHSRTLQLHHSIKQTQKYSGL